MPAIAGHYVVAYAVSGGFAGGDVRIAVAVAKAESGWDPSSRYVTSEEDSRGLWQINTYAHQDLNRAGNLYDPTYNAQAARTVWRNAGGRWTPWTTYTRGTYVQYLGDADAAIRAYNSLGGDAEAGAGSGGGEGAGAEGGVAPQPWGPYDFSLQIRGVGARFNEVGGALADIGDAMQSLYQF